MAMTRGAPEGRYAFRNVFFSRHSHCIHFYGASLQVVNPFMLGCNKKVVAKSCRFV